MGALTSSSSNHHKREYPFPFPHPKNPYAITNSIAPEYFHVPKRPKLSSPSSMRQTSAQQSPSVSNSTVDRISRYPETNSKFRRELHAPCRPVKFELSKPKPKGEVLRGNEGSVVSADEMGIFLSKRFDHAKRDAFRSLNYFGQGKNVIDVDTETPRVEKRQKEVVSDDSSVEEVVEVIDDENNENNEVKIVEERSSVITSEAYGNVVGVANVGKTVDLPGVNAAVDVSNVEVYKKLLENTEKKRNARLSLLGWEIEFTEKKWNQIKLSRPVKKPVEKPVEVIPPELFIPLTKEEQTEVKRAFLPQNRRNLLVSHKDSSIDISGEILQCLAPGTWLNDEVINLYLALLKEREKREPHKFLNCHFFNTFFYKKLSSGGHGAYDYKAVRRWTTERKLGYFLLNCDKIFVPVHREIHWCLAIINKKDKKFQYLDSLKGRDYRVLEYVAKYYVDEVKDKSRKDIDVSDWEHEFVEDLPEQQNGYDCGMFMIKYADFYSRGLQLCFGQEHMPYFRVRTAKEILKLRAD